MCFVCNGTLMKIKETLYKCLLCGQYQNPDGTPAKLPIFPSIDLVREHAVEGVQMVAVPEVYEEESGMPEDMVKFINRFSTRLTPALGYSPEVTKNILVQREEYRKGLEEVFGGNKDFQAWFDRTKTKTGLHRSVMVNMIYDCLQVLRHPEAVEMSEAYARAM